MKSFLELVAGDLRRRFGNDLSHTVVVFPNKRASLFFNEYLLPPDGSPVWAPRYLTISELFLSLSDKRLADPIDTVCRLYHHFVRLTGSKESLDFFYGWGERLLSDFDDVDKSQADARKVFRDLRDYGSLESFDYLTPEQIEQLQRFLNDFSKDKLTHLRQNFNRLWENLFAIYEALSADLASTGEAYEGRLYREVAEALEQGTIALPDSMEHVAFVGFNVIDKVEQTLFLTLQQQQKALFYWDYDTSYVSPDGGSHSEAGLFLQENLRMFPNALGEDQELFSNFLHDRDHRSIHFASAPTDMAQAQYVATWLQNPAYFDPAQAKRTAIVLCNENLLQPVLHSLPPSVRNVNVTKGFPLHHTPAYTCVENGMERIVAEMDRQAAAHAAGPDGDKPFVLPTGRENVPYLEQLCEAVKAQAQEVGQSAEGDELLRNLYAEAFFRAYTVLNRFVLLLQDGKLPVMQSTLFRLIRQVLRTVSVPFHGEPAVGLQVMGVLETRCLDFDHVLMLSVGEGILPQRSGDASFIPFLIRKQHRLTTPDRQVAVYAYYFHRLLQRARHVHLVYNASTEGTQRGEMSRFMRALLVEHNERLHIRHLRLESSPRTVNIEVSEGRADDADRPLFTQLSPSALKYYFKCPLQFYYHYVKRLRTPQDQDPIINANDFGSVFHLTAERLMLDVFNGETRDITPQRLQHFLKENSAHTLQQMVRQAFADNGLQGVAITEKAVMQYVKQLLRYEAGTLTAEGTAPATSFRVLDAERTSEIMLDVPFRGGTVPFRLFGDIDRRDEAVLPDGSRCMRIVDYKTGRKHDKPSYALDDFFSAEKDYPENPLQTFVYSLMWSRRTDLPVVPMLYYIPSMTSKDFSPYVCIDKEPVMRFQDIARDFERKLCDTLADIIDPAKPFPPTENEDYCKYCDYRGLCH